MISHKPQQTLDHAKHFAKQLIGGEVICLSGDLGAGKTTWVKGLALGLGIKQMVNSPSFNLLKRYSVKDRRSGVKYLYHLDLYRLELKTKKQQQDLIEALGLEEFLVQAGSVTVVEWGEKIKPLLPPKTLYLAFRHLTANKREIVSS